MSETAEAIIDAANEVEEIADTLRRIQAAALELLGAGLTRETLVLLLRHKSGVNKADVESVLWALSHLDDYLETSGDS